MVAGGVSEGLMGERPFHDVLSRFTKSVFLH